MIAIVDTGGANIGSVVDAFARIGAQASLTCDPRAIRAAAGVVLPGVGAAAESMARIRRMRLDEVLRGLTAPVLGICLGMQLLFERSEEGDVECLGLLPGTVRRLRADAGVRVPHMGWNRVRIARPGPLTEGLRDGEWFYFVHSYAAPAGPWTLAEASHGEAFPAVVGTGRVYGVQFHPERSAAAGSAVLRNFARLSGWN